MTIAKPQQTPEAFAGVGGPDADTGAGPNFAALFSELAAPENSLLQAATLRAGGKTLPGPGKMAAVTGNGMEELAEPGAASPVGLAELNAIPATLVDLPPASRLVDEASAGIGALTPGPADALPIAKITIVPASSLPPDPASASDYLPPSPVAKGTHQSAAAPLPREDIPGAGPGLGAQITVVMRGAPAVGEPSTAAALPRVRSEAPLAKLQPFAAPAQPLAHPVVSPRELVLPTADAGFERGDTSDRASPEGPPGPDPKLLADRATGTAQFAVAGPVMSVGTERPSGPVAALPAIAPQQMGTADAVASVVDRLMESRMLGHVAAASVSIHHAEFGKLDIAFAQPGSTLDVAVSAADSESQRALAAALQGGDRGSARDGGQTSSGSQAGTQHRPADTGGALRGGEGQSDARDAEQRRQHGRSGSGSDKASTPAARPLGDATASPSGIYA